MMMNLLRHAMTWRARILMPILAAAACLLCLPPAQANGDYLEPEQAFRFSARMADANTAEATFVIANGYYLFREQFGFEVTGARAGEPIIPPGKVKFDETFQKDVETYRGTVAI